MAIATPLVELDALEILVIVDNEVDPISTYSNPAIHATGNIMHIGMRSQTRIHGDHGAAAARREGRGNTAKELRMDSICCGAHGLSLMITAVKGNKRHTVLFDTGPEEEVWERNVSRLKVDVAAIELIHLSHWHRDHSGGMLRAIQLITSARTTHANTDSSIPKNDLIVDLHHSRPDYRGFMAAEPISLEADPSFAEISAAGGTVVKSDSAHTVLDDMLLISGFIPRATSYETGVVKGIRFNNSTSSWEKDELIEDERLMMCNLKGKGIVVFTGCSHAGVVNASRHAIDLAGGSVPLYAVVGGYHLVGPFSEPHVPETVQDLKKLGPKVLLAGHCSGWRVKYEIEKEMPGVLAPSTVGTHFEL